MSQKDFGQIFFNHFLEALKSHCPVSLGGQPRATNKEKVKGPSPKD